MLSTETQLVTFLDELTSEAVVEEKLTLTCLISAIHSTKSAINVFCKSIILWNNSHNQQMDPLFPDRTLTKSSSKLRSHRYFAVCSGVPHGTMFGVVLFLAFINEMPLSVTLNCLHMMRLCIYTSWLPGFARAPP